MCKRILFICYSFFVAITLSGCAALFIAYPDECKNEAPTTSTHDIFWSMKEPIKCWTKADFLKEWGKPVKIISTSENEETWIYERRLWCGLIPIYLLIPAPLLLPVCGGFDRIEFQDNVAKRLHTRRILVAGIILLPPGPLAHDPVCRHPIPPNHCVDADEASPATQVTTYR